jgi:hypothetical protein
MIQCVIVESTWTIRYVIVIKTRMVIITIIMSTMTTIIMSMITTVSTETIYLAPLKFYASLSVAQM